MFEQYRHWKLSSGSDGIALLQIDKADSKTNVLSHEVLTELNEVLSVIGEEPSFTGLVIASAKPSGFVYGADISEFDNVDSAEQGAQLAAEGQTIIGRIAALKIPSAAAIDGFALGGGLELALACRYRVAVESFDRRLGLPEVQLGIQPAFGGVVRMVGLLGPVQAMSMILSGRLVSAKQAKGMGLVDRLAKPGELIDEARRIVRRAPPVRRPPLFARLMNLPVVRPWLAKKLRQEVAQKADRRHYPAPYAIIDQWVEHGGQGAAALQAETRSIGELFVTPTSRNLVRVFGLREKLKGLAPRSNSIERVHVIGAGVMGGDIAAWCALRGQEVTLQDQAPEAIEKARTRAGKLFAKRLRAPGAADAAAARLRADVDGDGITSAQLVLEAIVERLDVKQTVFSAVEKSADETTVLATNTSSLRLEDIAEGLSRPQQLVGIHFFNPVAKMPLVEVIRGENTSSAAVDAALDFVTAIDKLPLPCSSAPGFLVNRVLTPYMFEALRAHVDGHALEEIDAAAVDFGMPVGPVELADQVGLDVAHHVAGIMRDTLGTEPPALLAQMVEAGRLGAKTQHGFYRWEDGKAQKEPWSGAISSDLQDRLILALVNECAACLSEGIVDDPDLVDAGVIFGTGFAPFRGGPLQYARTRGIDAVLARLSELARHHGPHLAPKAGWDLVDKKLKS